MSCLAVLHLCCGPQRQWQVERHRRYALCFWKESQTGMFMTSISQSLHATAMMHADILIVVTQLRLNKVSELIHNSTNHKNLAMARVIVHFQEILDTVSLPCAVHGITEWRVACNQYARSCNSTPSRALQNAPHCCRVMRHLMSFQTPTLQCHARHTATTTLTTTSMTRRATSQRSLSC